MSKLFKILSAELTDTKATADQPSQKYYKCTVTIDNTLRAKELAALYGTKVRSSQGGQTYRYAVLSNDPSFADIKGWLEDKAKGEDYPFLVEGDVHEMETAQGYHVTNPTTNKPVLDSKGNPQIAYAVVFFCPSANSATSQFRRISRTLDFVTVAEPATSEGDVL